MNAGGRNQQAEQNNSLGCAECVIIVDNSPNLYNPPKNGEIAQWPNTRVVKCKYCVSQKQNGFNNKIQWYSILLTFIFKFTARL